jgi:Domain of unknown function (DUF6487)
VCGWGRAAEGEALDVVRKEGLRQMSAGDVLAQPPCPKCKGEMEQGFVLDRTESGQHVSHWAKGAPRKSFWLVTKRVPHQDQVPIGTFRCSSCGYLEAYARKEFAPK